METGDNGVNGVHVLRHVNKENRRGNVNATHLLHCMVERNVMESLMKLKIATKTYHVQVI